MTIVKAMLVKMLYLQFAPEWHGVSTRRTSYNSRPTCSASSTCTLWCVQMNLQLLEKSHDRLLREFDIFNLDFVVGLLLTMSIKVFKNWLTWYPFDDTPWNCYHAEVMVYVEERHLVLFLSEHKKYLKRFMCYLL